MFQFNNNQIILYLRIGANKYESITLFGVYCFGIFNCGLP